MKFGYFKTEDFHSALRKFFKNLNIPVNYIAEEPARPQEILSKTYKKGHPAFQLMNDVYFLGMVDDAAFEGNAGLAPEKIESDYDGVLIFGVTLNPRNNDLLPTRSQLAEITRSFNREFHYTPVVVVFKYENHIAFANAERLKYKQEWREGEKAGKVSLLRDVDFDNPHSGHLRILSELAISRSGKKAINTFDDLYTYWQSVFSVSLLNKKFYDELSNWYFWAVKEVTFPSEPTIEDVVKEIGKIDDRRLDELKQEHNAKNVIRLLTRFLFVWFIKEKKLIPAQLFDLEYLKKEILKDLSPYHEGGLFKPANINSHYYKAILQNLFLATLNQEMGKRAFRKEKQNMNITNLLRYEGCFKNPQEFINLVESTVPFMNGGLFECLDKPHPTKKGKKGGDVIVYKDGFSDRNDNPLIVPDYLFFGLDEEVDLSSVIGIKNKKTKQAAVKGLINIFESYKFTIAENTPIEEDIALDPELLGKVFENLLASYNPETKTTARKQTGSFYTPREIVNYMVDESLIAYLKNEVKIWGIPEDELDTKLHQLLSFETINPFAGNQTLQIEIIKALDHCAILDPACGSGAFPMGILQKMVHILQKVDPKNEYWHELQREKALKETESAFHLVDKDAREQKLIEINDAFDKQVNDPDYARKLFLIENCIYGVDIQPIAAQISKLRFFISLVVDQKVNKTKSNFGIRPLPNLETKFVAANTLIGIEKPDKEGNLFENQEIMELEEELKDVRHRIFSAKTPPTKRKLRKKDQELRENMEKLLIADGWENKTARQLAGWDPYDQNASSSFFDLEWMFGIKDGFNVVIGNPPYLESKKLPLAIKKIYLDYKSATGKFDLFVLFIEKGMYLLKKNGLLTFINPTTFMNKEFGIGIKKLIEQKYIIKQIIDFADIQVFENATNYTGIFHILKNTSKSYSFNYIKYHRTVNNIKINDFHHSLFYPKDYNFCRVININNGQLSDRSWTFKDETTLRILNLIEKEAIKFKEYTKYIFVGIQSGKDEVFFVSDEQIREHNLEKEIIYPILKGKDVRRFMLNWSGTFIIYPYDKNNNVISETELSTDFPNIYNYLVRKKNKLSGRSYFENSSKQWYELWCERKISKFKETKIVNAEISPENRFYLDKGGYLGNTKIFSSVLKPPYQQLYGFFIGILNSKLMNYCHKLIASPKAGGFYDYKTQFISQYPIKLNCSFEFPIISLSNFINSINEREGISSTNACSIFTDVLDGLVFELYFPNHIKEKEIDILQFVEKNLSEVMQDRDFEQLTDSEKENIINRLYARWTHPDSEVRNRIKLFAVRSPEILKPILESR